MFKRDCVKVLVFSAYGLHPHWLYWSIQLRIGHNLFLLRVAYIGTVHLTDHKLMARNQSQWFQDDNSRKAYNLLSRDQERLQNTLYNYINDKISIQVSNE